MSKPGYDTCDMCGAHVSYPRRKLASNIEYKRGRFTSHGKHYILCEECYWRVYEYIMGDDLR